MTNLKPRAVARYGWRRDTLDPRDHRLTVPRPTAGIPLSVDLRKHMPPVYDQGQLGSCTANAIGAAVEFAQMVKDSSYAITPSRLFIYYGERLLEHTVNTDAGAEIRDGMKVVATDGSPPESTWPYAPEKFATRPPAAAYRAARSHLATAYARVDQSVDGLRRALAAGFPVVFGFTVFESFESDEVAKTGVVPNPKRGEKNLGGHAVLLVGYDHAKKLFRVRNSWGPGWGQDGYFDMPYEYVRDPGLASDFWTLTRES